MQRISIFYKRALSLSHIERYTLSKPEIETFTKQGYSHEQINGLQYYIYQLADMNHNTNAQDAMGVPPMRRDDIVKIATERLENFNKPKAVLMVPRDNFLKAMKLAPRNDSNKNPIIKASLAANFAAKEVTGVTLPFNSIELVDDYDASAGKIVMKK